MSADIKEVINELVNEAIDRRIEKLVPQIRKLLIALKKDIDDDFRATDDPEDNTPGMCVTIGSDDLESWSYQTGDNSFTGGAYGYRYWGVIYLYRDSNSGELAQQAVDEIADQLSGALI